MSSAATKVIYRLTGLRRGGPTIFVSVFVVPRTELTYG